MKRASQAFAGAALALVMTGVAIRETPQNAGIVNEGESAISKSSIAFGEEKGWQATAVQSVMGDTSLPDLKMNAGLAKIIGGDTLYTLQPGGRWPMASLTKLMTGTITLENIPAGNARDERLRRMMVISDNAAAEELADTLGHDEWIRIMNEKAARLKMTDTGFADASGLSYLNQSTAYDIEKLVSYIVERHPELLAMSKAPSVMIGTTAYANINEFAARPDFIGGKTGFTDEANGNLVSVFETDQGPLMLIVLGAGGKTERFKETEKLLSWLQRHFKLYGY